MKKKISIIMALLTAVALLVLVCAAIVQAAVTGPDPNSASGLQYCPKDWWSAGGKPVDGQGDLTANGITVPNVTQDGCLTQQELSHVQPGLGTVMDEVGYRAWVMYYAAQGGNWQLANYEGPKEMAEIMETGAITRPGKSNALLGFMDGAPLGNVTTAITNHDLAAFNTAYANMISACNSCHATYEPEITYSLSSDKPADLSLGVGEDLVLSAAPARWSSYADYVAGILSVDLTIHNKGKDTASNTQINSATSTNGVADIDTMPVAAGAIGAGASANVTLKYQVPQGVSTFRTVIQGQTQDGSGHVYGYPAPGIGSAVPGDWAP